VADEAAAQKAADCAALRPEPIPRTALELIAALPAIGPNESEDAWRARLTPAERGIADWYASERREGAAWLGYGCPA
jgi:hypothetical protein